MSGRIFQHEDKFQAWTQHIGGRFIKNPNSFECILPDNAGVIHISADEAYAHGLNSTKTQAEDTLIQTNGVKNGSPDKTIQHITDPKLLIVTLDEDFGTLEIINTWNELDSNKDMLRIEAHFNEELNTAEQNWESLTPEQRGTRLNALPDSHHRDIIIKELKDAGLKINGLENDPTS